MAAGSDPILVTGAAGFIGFHVSQRLGRRGESVVGLDNLNPYYDVGLKKSRLEQLQGERFEFAEIDIAHRDEVQRLFEKHRFQRVIHLAAQAGVRYSLENPHAYVESNLAGFVNLLESCRLSSTRHFVYASSSSVYGANKTLPFSEHAGADHPMSLYGATKKANELIAHSYSSLFSLPTTGLRFFTVYGPWGRPDMALFKFTKSILEGTPIDVYNEGKMVRDFTYIDDVAEGVVRVLDHPPQPDPQWDGRNPDPASSYAPYRVYNIGNNRPVELLRYIQVLEECLGKKAQMRMMPMQPGDVQATAADVSDLMSELGFRPATSVEMGVRRFVDWYTTYYGNPLESNSESPEYQRKVQS